MIYKYKVVSLIDYSLTESFLNELGIEGWRLVFIHNSDAIFIKEII